MKNAKQVTHSACPYKAIVADALKGCVADLRDEKQWFISNATGLNDAIRKACLSQFPSAFTGILVTHSHQRRNGKLALQQAAGILLACESEIAKARDFSELYQLIGARIGRLERIGDLATYDISERIAWHLGLEPDAVYLHTGTLRGARAIGISDRRRVIPIDDLPSSFRKLTGSEIENVLCVYKSQLKNPKLFRPDRRQTTCARKPARRGC